MSRFILALVGLLFCACAPDKIEGKWFAGDFHVHSRGASNDVSGGGGFPDEIKRLAQERGLDFVVLTDHSNATGSGEEEATEDPTRFNQGPEFVHHALSGTLSDENFVMVVGSEISPYDEEGLSARGHVGCLPPANLEHDVEEAFIDRPSGAVTGASAVEQANARGCFSVVNHPYSDIASWIEYDWTSEAYDALEVWNGGLRFDDADEGAVNAFLCDRLAGKNTVMVGGSDAHRLTDSLDAPLSTPLAYPTTYVFAKDLRWKSLHEGLTRGRTMVSDFDISLSIKVMTGGDEVALPGDTARGKNLRLNVVAKSPMPALLRAQIFRPGGCVSDPRTAPDAASRRARPLVQESGRVIDELLAENVERRFDVELDDDLSGALLFIRIDSDEPNGHALAAPIEFE